MYVITHAYLGLYAGSSWSGIACWTCNGKYGATMAPIGFETEEQAQRIVDTLCSQEMQIPLSRERLHIEERRGREAAGIELVPEPTEKSEIEETDLTALQTSVIVNTDETPLTV